MTAQVIVTFGPGREFEYRIDDPSTPGLAREWIDSQSMALGAEAAHASGQGLLADRIVGIAIAAGTERFASDPDWAAEFSTATAGALERDLVHIDIEAETIRY